MQSYIAARKDNVNEIFSPLNHFIVIMPLAIINIIFRFIALIMFNAILLGHREVTTLKNNSNTFFIQLNIKVGNSQNVVSSFVRYHIANGLTFISNSVIYIQMPT